MKHNCDSKTIKREKVRKKKKNTRVNEKPLRSAPFQDKKQESV